MLLSLLLACWNDVAVVPKRFVDNPGEDWDEDGYFDPDDCDDGDPEINLAITYYYDGDSDGYGIENDSVTTCPSERPQGYVPAKEEDGELIFDCDDASALNNYDDVDGDGLTTCDGDCDDYNISSVEQVYFYRDNDGDGFGVENDAQLECPRNQPVGYVEGSHRLGELAFDCDDEEPLVHPDAIEVCDDVDNDCDSEVDNYIGPYAPRYYLDSDADGYGNESEYVNMCDPPSNYVDNFADCDDSDSSVHPFASELCDGVDNNCNLVADEGVEDAPIWFRDADSDGFGEALNTQKACEQPTGYVSNPTDCDDADAEVNPSAQESCNNLDDNCDGNIDEGSGISAPLGSSTWYYDADSDGYGNLLVTLEQCDIPAGYIDNSEDCNDADANIYPQATEYCNEIDDDCDGTIDGATAIDKEVYYADSDGDGYGGVSSSQLFCAYDLPSNYVADPSDCDDSDSLQYPGAFEFCNQEDDDCNGLIDDDYAVDALELYEDGDEDGEGNAAGHVIYACSEQYGLVDNDLDCDDSNANINTSATEYCNNLDDDCNGAVDDSPVDQTTYYADSDGDGYGVSISSIVQCPVYSSLGVPSIPTGFAEFDGDCDDSEPAISPGVQELCTDTIDENCDGDNTLGAIDPTVWYADSDTDGYGNPNFFISSCTAPAYYVDNSGDCNDNDLFVHPQDDSVHFDPNLGAGDQLVHEELCNGKLDLCENDSTGGNTTPEEERDDDGDGWIECTMDIDLLYWPDSSIQGDGDCDDDDVETYPDAPEVCDGVYNDCDHGVHGSDAPYNEIDDDGDGYVECEIIDINDWKGEISVAGNVIGGSDCNDGSAITKPGGAPNTDPTACLSDSDGDGYADRLWSLCPTSQTMTEARVQFSGDESGMKTGYSVASAGDVDNDGQDDILISEPYALTPQNMNAGAVHLIYGSTIESISSLDVSAADISFWGEANSDRAGHAIASAGDIDGDGLDDIMMSAPYHDVGPLGGKVYLFKGSSLVGNSLNMSNADYIFVGSNSEAAGFSLSSAGDVDGDGLDDILIGAYSNSESGSIAGRVYLIFGSELGSAQEIQLSSASVTFSGEIIYYFGWAVSSAGDVDGDGLDDILMGAPRAPNQNANNSGIAYLALASSISAGDNPVSGLDYRFHGLEIADRTGQSFAFGNLDGDALSDIVIGSPVSNTAGADSGRADIFFGASLANMGGDIDITAADSTYLGETNNDNAGTSLSLAGDVDGDGLDDILMGAPGYELPNDEAGKAYLILGSSIGSGIRSLGLADFFFTGENEGDGFGETGVGAGDIDGDGLDDILIGYPYSDIPVSNSGGAALYSACEN